MFFKVKLVVEYDNFGELSEEIDYRILGEETLLEKNISVGYQDFKKLVIDLKRTMFTSGNQRNSTDIFYNNGTLSVVYKILNVPKNYGTEVAKIINKVCLSFKEYLNSFDKVNINNNFMRVAQSNNSQMIRINSQGINLSFEETEKIFNYLNENNISYKIYQGESSSVEVGASGGFSNLFILINNAANIFTILTAIKDLFGGDNSAIVVQKIDNILEKKAKKLISERYHIHSEQIFFEEQNNKQFIFKTKVNRQYYEVIFDDSNKVDKVSPLEEFH